MKLSKHIKALQLAINTGIVWRLEGSQGRAAIRALETGECILGPNPSHDAFGNRIPSRFEVKDESKGALFNTETKQGEDYLDALLALDNIHITAQGAGLKLALA